jgi:hypothetical protein
MDGSGSNGNNENWKQFRGTELGSMLSGIYGNQRPQINYPQPKKKAFDPAKQKFLPVNAKVNSGQWQDPRKTTRRETSGKVSVPTGFKGAGYQRENYAPIDFIVARKGYSEIKKEIDVTKERSRAYRPPINNFKIGEDEKERYSQVCAYKGGKGMIEAGTHISRDQTPYEVAQQRKRIDQESAFRASRKLGLSARSTNRAAALAPVAPKQLSDKEQMADQIAAEINERADYLEEMEALGDLSKAEKKRLQGEIRTRTIELESMQL